MNGFEVRRVNARYYLCGGGTITKLEATILRDRLNQVWNDEIMIQDLLDEVRPHYPGLIDNDIIIAGLEELLYQNRRER